MARDLVCVLFGKAEDSKPTFIETLRLKEIS